jgi:hypothetical protein
VTVFNSQQKHRKFQHLRNNKMIKQLGSALLLLLVAHLCNANNQCTLGGTGGNAFSDSVPDGYHINQIVINYGIGNIVNAISASYMNGDGQYIGGAQAGNPFQDGISQKVLNLDYTNGEYIVVATGGAGSLMDSVRFITNFGQDTGPLGGTGGTYYSCGGKELLYLAGRGGADIDSLTFTFRT